MSSLEYLEALGAALANTVPARERMDILRYYKEYFEDAGPEREQEIIADLGDPEALAQRIIADGGYGEEDGQSQPQPQPQPEPVPLRDGAQPKRRVWPYVLLGVGIVALIAIVSIVPRLVWGVVRDRVVDPIVGGVTAGYEEGPSGEAPESLMPNQTEQAVGEFNEISVHINLGDVTVQTGDGFNISLSEPENMSLGLEYSVANGKLEVWSDASIDLTDFANGKNVEYGVTVTVPEDAPLSWVDAYTDLGDVTLSNICAREVEAGTGLGDIEVRQLQGSVDELSLNTGMGDITLEGKLPLEGDLETGMGDVRVSAACSGRQCHYELETGMGEVKVDGRGHGREAENSDSGCIYELDASSGMGDVRVDFAS